MKMTLTLTLSDYDYNIIEEMDLDILKLILVKNANRVSASHSEVSSSLDHDWVSQSFKYCVNLVGDMVLRSGQLIFST